MDYFTQDKLVFSGVVLFIMNMMSSYMNHIFNMIVKIAKCKMLVQTRIDSTKNRDVFINILKWFISHNKDFIYTSESRLTPHDVKIKKSNKKHTIPGSGDHIFKVVIILLEIIYSSTEVGLFGCFWKMLPLQHQMECV